MIRRYVIDSIGQTPLVQLQKIVSRGSARVWQNSMGQPHRQHERRMAINHRSRRGRWSRDRSTVVNTPRGRTGVSLALVCAAKGYDLHMFTPTPQRREEVTMRAFRARITSGFSDDKKITEGLIKEMIEPRAGSAGNRITGGWIS